jgi:septal ring factor EnvC (AmiA/AmiB activator)
MFNIFKKLKQFKMNEQELAAVQEERGKMYDAINRLNTANKEQTSIIAQLKIDLNDAQNKVRELAEQLNMMHAQKQASDRFNDNDRNY